MGANQSAYPVRSRHELRYDPIPSFLPYQHNPITLGLWESHSSGKFMKSRNLNSSYILCGTINRNPPNTQLEFLCPNCSKTNFDGGLSKKVTCSCKKSLLRKENEEIR